MMHCTRHVAAFLLLLLSQAVAVKLYLSPYASECVTEVASADGDTVTGSFVGTIAGGREGVFVSRVYFDMLVNHE